MGWNGGRASRRRKGNGRSVLLARRRRRSLARSALASHRSIVEISQQRFAFLEGAYAVHQSFEFNRPISLICERSTILGFSCGCSREVLCKLVPSAMQLDRDMCETKRGIWPSLAAT